MHVSDCRFVLKIHFTIEALSLDVGDAVGIGALEQNQICRKSLILGDFDDLANLEVFPLIIDETMLFLVNSLHSHFILGKILRLLLGILTVINDHIH